MSFRIGITIGDVVERDGDLLGDGVNIAARLEGLAEVGGICISRAVHEQVANKLSVQFADIGAQKVKNIPTPVHAYLVAMRREDGSYSMPKVKKKSSGAATTPSWMWPAALVCIVAIGVGGFLYFAKMKMPDGSKGSAPASNDAAAIFSPPVAPIASPVPTTAAPAPPPSASPPGPLSEKFAAETVPFVSNRTRLALSNEYAPASDHKAFALNVTGTYAIATSQQNEELAKTAALEQCQKKPTPFNHRENASSTPSVTRWSIPHGKPPLPPLPWIRHDPSTEKPYVTKDMPLVRDIGKTRLESYYVPGKKTRSIAVSPGGLFIPVVGAETIEDSARRSLESCGAIAGVPCMIVAVDDVFVVPVPTMLKVTGFFQAAGSSSIAADARDDVSRKLMDASSGWNAVAVGVARRPGLALKAASEPNAVNEALGNCVKHDSDCRVIAIGPFSVGPN
jgi:adenylate cyclase